MLGGVAVLVALAMVMSTADASAIAPRVESPATPSARQVQTGETPDDSTTQKPARLLRGAVRVVVDGALPDSAPRVGALSLRDRLVTLSDVTLPPPALRS